MQDQSPGNALLKKTENTDSPSCGEDWGLRIFSRGKSI